MLDASKPKKRKRDFFKKKPKVEEFVPVEEFERSSTFAPGRR